MRLLAEEEPVARGAGGHAVAEQALLDRAARACGRVAPVVMIIDAARYSRVADPDAERRRREVDAVGVGGDELGAEALGLLAELHHQLGAEDAVGEAGVVLDVGGEHELPAGADALDDDRVQVRAGGVDGRGQSGGAGADDDDARGLRAFAHDGFVAPG